jgi:serine/threonine protein phosphatase 1
MTGRLFVIGDVHGCAAELEVLVQALPLAAGDTVACVGDYFDRGPDSKVVVELLLALRDRHDVATTFLKGNHEDMCLDYLGRTGRWGEAWLQNGGIATLRSYGIDPRLAGADAARMLPASHLAFLETLVSAHVAEPYLLVHAGVRPGRAWDDQDEEDLLWIREEFIVPPHGLPYTIVFGHTPQRHVYVQAPYKIGIDTGCVYGGMLTGLELPAGVVHQVRLGERRVRQSRLAL